MVKLLHREGYKPKKNCNGCGAGWSAKVVPNTIYFMGIRRACCIHDDRYEYGATAQDKIDADDEFLDNLYLLIEADKNWFRNNRIVKSLMRKRAFIYYEAVHQLGDDAFWEGK